MNKKKREQLLLRAKARKKKQIKREHDKTPFITIDEYLDDDAPDGIYENAIYNGSYEHKAYFIITLSNGEQRKMSGRKAIAHGFDDESEDTYSLVTEVLPKGDYKVDLMVIQHAELE